MRQHGHDRLAVAHDHGDATGRDAALEGGQHALGGKATGITLDVTRPDAIDTVVRAAGRVDVLVNNAGLQHVARLEEFPADRWALLVAGMLTGAANLARAVLPDMRARNFGRIINLGSIHSLVASPYKSAYVAAKHGLIGFSKSVALETGDADITINTVCPSYVKTPLVESQIASLAATHHMTPEQVVDEIMLKPMPKRQFISLEELTGTVEFLLSDAARNITGQCITLDGGWTAQ